MSVRSKDLYKLCNDAPLENRQWAKLTSVILEEVTRMEMEIIRFFDYRVAPTSSELEHATCLLFPLCNFRS